MYLDNQSANEWSAETIKAALSSENGSLTLQATSADNETKNYLEHDYLLTRKKLEPAGKQEHVTASEFRQAQDDFSLSRIAALCSLSDMDQVIAIANNAENEASVLALFQELPTEAILHPNTRREDFAFRYNSLITHSVLTALLSTGELSALKSEIVADGPPTLSWSVTTNDGEPIDITFSQDNYHQLNVQLKGSTIEIDLGRCETAEELSDNLRRVLKPE